MILQKKINVWIISGPLGIGKSSVSRLIKKKLGNCIRIEGDYFFLQMEGIKNVQWEERIKITWENVLSTINNYIEHGFDNFVIDFVVEDEKEWLCCDKFFCQVCCTVCESGNDFTKVRYER